MKRSSYFTIALFAMAALFAGCAKTEIAIPDPVADLKAYPGLNRAKVEFFVPSEAVSYKVFYSTGKVIEEEITDASKAQSVIVEGLASGENIIRAVALNADGNNSDPRGVIVQVYDESYGSNLVNRELIDQSTISSTSVELYFGDANDGEVELRIEYVGTDGSDKVLSVAPDETVVRIEGIDLSKDYFFYAVYKPTEDFIDEYPASSINARTASMKNFEKEVWLAGGAAAAIDNDASTSWTPSGGESLVVDMQVEKIYEGFSIVQAGNLKTSTFASRFRFESSNDNVNWEVVRDAKLKLNGYKQTYSFSKPLSSRYFRITFTETYTSDLPIAIAEIDLYNDLRTSGENGDLMPQIVNGKTPFEMDGIDRFAGVIPGRFYQVTDWIHDGALVSCDNPRFCTWCAPAWGLPAITNGKIYQLFDMHPGVYGFKIDVGHTTNADGVDMFAVAAKGGSIPDIEALASSADVLGCGDVVAHVSSVYTVPFTVFEDCQVAIGVVYSMYDLLGATGIPWSDMYINSFEIEAQ